MSGAAADREPKGDGAAREGTSDAAGRLLSRMEAREWHGRIVPVHHLADLRDAIEGPHGRGDFDEALFGSQLGFLSFEPPAELPDARSIIVVAVPAPQGRVFFHRHGVRVPVVIPPTYVGYTTTTVSVQAELAGWLVESGHRLAATRLPLKTLAVRSGLAEWGRNNVAYVPGLGSFLQLVGGYSDLPADGDPWREPTGLHRCARCRACMRRCPAGAIDPERFLLHAERCLTYHNEAAADFPDWIDPAWHHCLVGCMRCQTICPLNQEWAWRYEDRAEFTEEETAALLRQEPLEGLPAATAAKVRSLEMDPDYRLLCRNLALIMARSAP